MKMYTYALVLFFTVIVCIVASYDRRLRFDRYFSAYWSATAMVAVPFILWDIWFTARGVWWFNLDYTLGYTLFGLPVEEVLFFFCIPFSCTFTYYCFDLFFPLPAAQGFNNMLVFLGTVAGTLVALFHYQHIYTLCTALTVVFTLIVLHGALQEPWISKATLVYCILLLGFFPVNGVLTGTGLDAPIVNYRPGDFLELRIGTIPIEDAFYGYAQFLWVIYFFQKFRTYKDNAQTA
jgi:lycopene cyclase domain-containing protein